MNEMNQIIQTIETQIKVIKDTAILIENNLQNYILHQNIKKINSESYKTTPNQIQNKYYKRKINSIAQNTKDEVLNSINSINNQDFKAESDKNDINQELNGLEQKYIPKENSTLYKKQFYKKSQLLLQNETESSQKMPKKQMKEFLESLESLDFNPTDFPHVYINRMNHTYQFQKLINKDRKTVTIGSIGQNNYDTNLKILIIIIQSQSEIFDINKQLKDKLIEKFKINKIKLNQNDE